MDDVKAAELDAVVDAVAAQAEAEELLPGYVPMLPVSDPSDRRIGALRC